MKKIMRFFMLTLIAGLAALLFGNNDCSAAFKLNPEGQKLYKQWNEVLDFCAQDYVKKNDPAPEIEAGMTITPKNAKDYPGLKNVLPEAILKRLDPDFFCPIQKILVTETRPRYYAQPVIDGCRDALKNVRLNKETYQIDGYKYGIPFPRPTEALHLIWNVVITNISMEENLRFDPITATSYGKSRKPDTIWKAVFGRYRVKGRLFTDVTPDREAPFFKGKGIMEQGTMEMRYPQDMRGTAFLRTRYWDVDKPDYFVSYLPGLKRIRVMSGSDAQDPIVGSELTWDSWALDWQKQPTRDKNLFPNEYKILGEKIILQPILPVRPSLRIEGEQFYTKWEKRPVWILEIKSLDPTYTTSRRVLYVDKEHLKCIYAEQYDRRSSLWRGLERFDILLQDGQCTWEGASAFNYVTERHTVFRMNSHPNPPLDPADFDMRWLNRMAR